FVGWRNTHAGRGRESDRCDPRARSPVGGAGPQPAPAFVVPADSEGLSLRGGVAVHASRSSTARLADLADRSRCPPAAQKLPADREFRRAAILACAAGAGRAATADTR